ncbi:MAG: hypothetical protein CMJ65_08210 [Planctomycetaceae bacterium]|nr:hypothetical protein [Planctomycetaceae bacterium]
MQGRRGGGGLLRFLGCGLLVWLSLMATAQAQQTAEEKAAIQDYVVAQGFQKKKLFNEAATRWKKFLTAHPKFPRLSGVRLSLAVCQLQLKQHTEAVATLRQLLKLSPQYKLADRVQYNLGLGLENIAIASKKPADYRTAAVEYGRVGERYPKSALVTSALYYQAECLYRAGQLEPENKAQVLAMEAAVAAYSKALSLKPSVTVEPDILYGLGTTQEQLEKHAEAAVTYQAFLAKYAKRPEATEITLRLGLCLFRQEKYPAAEPLFARAAAVKDFPQADLALLQQGHALRQQKKLPEAALAFESLPKRFAKSGLVGEALLAAGKCRFDVKQFPQARTALVAVVSLPKAAEAAEAATWLGRVLVELKQPAEAVKVYDRAIAAYAKSPRLPELAYLRCEALYAQPDKRAGVAAEFMAFAQKHPDHELAANGMYMASLVNLQTRKVLPSRKAVDAFLGQVKFKQHRLRPEVLYVGGQAYLLGDAPDWARAEVLFRELVTTYPKHKHTPAGIVRIGFCLYRAEKFDPAVTHLKGALGGLADPALKAEAGLLLGRCQLAAKRPEPATAAFRAALAAHPKWDRADELLYVLGAALKDQQQHEAAAVELKKLDSQFPKSTFRDRALYDLGDIARGQKKSDLAVASFRKVVAEFPKSEVAPLAQYGIGASLFEAEDFKAAEVALKELTTKHAKNPIVPQGRRLRARCLRELKDFAGAVSELTVYLAGKPAPPVDGALEARYELALCQVGLKQHKAVIATLTAILKDKPDFAQKDNILYELAFACEADKQAPQALAAYRRLVAEVPASPLVAECWFRIGQALEKTKDVKQLPEAEKAYGEGLKQVKKNLTVRQSLLYQLGWVQYRQEHYKEAVANLQAFLKEFPKATQARDATLLAGECLYLQKNWKAAVVFFDKAASETKSPERARSLYRAGTCHLNLLQWPLAQQRFEVLVKEFPKYPQLSAGRYGLGLALQKQNQLDRAVVVFEQVTKETSTESAAKARFMVGECAFAKKEYKKAYEHFLVAAFKYPYMEWQAKGFLEAGRCFKVLKDHPKAREMLETVIKKFPKRPEAKAAMQVLTTLPKPSP